ncbi:transposase [Halomonas sp. TBZ9]|uniref:Transposase n=1 Tax=Vreelandella azerica TaxID=2732867 RepID=A0A7Y3TZ81_9GAMM|nr:transposase [Halomonas azerica]
MGKYYSGGTGRAEKGLEISTLAVVNVTENTAYHLSTRQTIDRPESEQSRVDGYLHHLQQDRASLPSQVRYLVADGYYSKTRYIQGVVALGLHQIGKLRHDANLRWLYRGEQKRRGRKRRYDGKVSVEDVSRWTLAGNINETQVYTAIVNSAHFKRDLRVVSLVKHCGDKVKTALLFSTDTSLDAMTLVTYYKARFQIEFLFRDAKQFLGLNDCQARKEKALHFHFNASMTALNLLKLEDRQYQVGIRRVNSIARWRTFKANAHLLERFSSYLGLDFNRIKSRPDFDEMCHYGAIASAPEPFHEYIVMVAALAVHADPDAMIFENVCEGLTGELDTLIGIEISPALHGAVKASSRTSTQKSVSMVLETRQDGTLRLYQSMMATRYMKPN